MFEYIKNNLKSDFSSKVRWRTRMVRDVTYAILQDKYAVKEFADSKCVSSPETLFVTNNPNKIPFDNLPDRYFIKANHGCAWNIYFENGVFYKFGHGGNLVADDGFIPGAVASERLLLTQSEVVSLCENWMEKKYSQIEWAYTMIKPLIVVEECLEGSGKLPLVDYRFYVFDGVVKAVNLGSSYYRKHNINLFLDRDWNQIPMETRSFNLPDTIPVKPECFSEMVSSAERLAEGYDFLRVDLYNTTKGIMLGEITLYPNGGQRNSPSGCRSFDDALGKYWRVSNIQSIAIFGWNLLSFLKLTLFHIERRLKRLFS
jgi:hypothetical protein